MSTMELEPWIVLQGTDESKQPALWQIAGQPQPAIAFFTTEDAAQQYVSNTMDEGQTGVVRQCDRNSMLRILIECHKQGVELVALDPNLDQTKKVFQVSEVLRAAREQLG